MVPGSRNRFAPRGQWFYYRDDLLRARGSGAQVQDEGVVTKLRSSFTRMVFGFFTKEPQQSGSLFCPFPTSRAQRFSRAGGQELMFHRLMMDPMGYNPMIIGLRTIVKVRQFFTKRQRTLLLHAFLCLISKKSYPIWLFAFLLVPTLFAFSNPFSSTGVQHFLMKYGTKLKMIRYLVTQTY